jgi:hypothetical protein
MLDNTSERDSVADPYSISSLILFQGTEGFVRHSF